MNARAVLFVLGNLLGILGLCTLAPAAVAIVYAIKDGWDAAHLAEVVHFVATSLLCMAGGLAGRRAFRAHADGVRLREGFAIVSLSWMLMAVVGMMPYLLSGYCPSVTDAFFETMSGFTTTGATIFDRVEDLPPALGFWRCMTQWLGGMGVVVLSVALLPMLGVGGYRLLKAEAPGGVVYERERPRITDAAKALWRLYMAFTVVLCALLYWAGMSLYDAICHAFTTMSTGGFSTHSASMGHFSPLLQWIVIVFMFLAGMNFSLHPLWLRGRLLPVGRNSEWRLYVGIVSFVLVAGVLTMTGRTVVGGGPLGEPLIRDITFQVVSLVTTTGYGTADYNVWPQLMRMLLLALMFVGGCMGSTAGGMKMARMIIYGKALVRELHRMIFPHAIRPIRVNKRVLHREVVANILAFGLLFVGAVVLGALVLTTLGYDLTTSISAAASAMGNIGPALGDLGPTHTWSQLPAVAKWTLSLLMLMGRLELFSVVILFTPWLWRR